jgi:hypothetical protein
VPRDGGPADRQLLGELADRPVAVRSSSTIARRFGSPRASKGSPDRACSGIASE